MNKAVSEREYFIMWLMENDHTVSFRITQKPSELTCSFTPEKLPNNVYTVIHHQIQCLLQICEPRVTRK